MKPTPQRITAGWVFAHSHLACTRCCLYTGANQIQCLDADSSGLCDGTEFVWQYDAYGNLLNNGTSTYTYDAANRLISVTDAASTTTYAYNGDGDRVSQTVDGTLTTYTLDTATPLTRLLAEATGPNTTFTLHGLGLVAQSDGSTTEYFSADGLGSVRQLTDSTGSVLLNQTFDPYGNPYGSTGPGDTRFGFTGEQVDGNGLVYLRARYYQPEMGRFLNADPSRQERNPYQYAMANPVLHTDPSGLQAGSPCAESDWLCQIMFMLTASIVSAPPTVADPLPYSPSYGDPLAYPPYSGDPYLLPEIYPSIRSPNISPKPMPWRFLRNCGLALLFLDVLTWCGSTPTGCGHPELDAQNLPHPSPQPQPQPAPLPLPPVDPAPPRDRDDDIRVSLYRAIEDDELAFVESVHYQHYGHSPHFGGKYFSLTYTGMLNFADSFPYHYTYTSTTVPEWVLDHGYRFYDPGGAGASIHFDDTVLDTIVYPNMTPIVVMGSKDTLRW